MEEKSTDKTNSLSRWCLDNHKFLCHRIPNEKHPLCSSVLKSTNEEQKGEQLSSRNGRVGACSFAVLESVSE
jgi:hypothetical protein